jgi:hypothetical protein
MVEERMVIGIVPASPADLRARKEDSGEERIRLGKNGYGAGSVFVSANPPEFLVSEIIVLTETARAELRRLTDLTNRAVHRTPTVAALQIRILSHQGICRRPHVKG